MAWTEKDSTIHRQFAVCEVLWVPQSIMPADRASLNAANDLASFNTVAGSTWLSGSFSDDRKSPYQDIVAASWSKDTTTPAGVFSIQLKPTSRDWLVEIKPGDVFLLYMGNTPQDVTLLTLGIVDRVAESTTVTGEGVTSRTVIVTGRDLGKILQETNTVFDPVFAQIDPVAQVDFSDEYIGRFKEKYGLSPNQNVVTLLDIFYNEKRTNSSIVKSQWLVPGSDRVPLMALVDFKSFVQVPMFGYSMLETPPLVESGNVWTLCESYANTCINEFFLDVRDVANFDAEGNAIQDPSSRIAQQEVELYEHLSEVASAFVEVTDIAEQKSTISRVDTAFRELRGNGLMGAQESQNTRARQRMALVFRQMPYDTDAFAKLPTHEVHETEIRDSDLGVAAHDVYNFFRVRMANFEAIFQEVTYGILINKASIRHNGLRTFDLETKYCFVSSEQSREHDAGNQKIACVHVRVLDYYSQLTATWYAYNEKLFAGSITMRLRPEIRVGHRIMLTRTGVNGAPEAIALYVQAVQQNYMFEATASTTTLTVVRGVKARNATVLRQGLAVASQPETAMYWRATGRVTSVLFADPYELFTEQGVIPEAAE